MSASAELDRSLADWEANARVDPRFAILSDPTRTDGAWDLASFLATGEQEIARVWAHLDHLGIAPSGGAALDFGCGLGRLTAALARRTGRATGVDVSATMVSTARDVHAEAVARGVLAFEVNERPDLRRFPTGSVDVVYSNIVLQHLRAPLQRAYIGEFCRVLAPGGLAVFQIPSRRRGAAGFARRHLPDRAVAAARSAMRPPRSFVRADAVIRMEMNCLPEDEVVALVDAAGGEIAHVVYSNATRPDFNGDLVLFDRDEAWRRARGGGYVSPVYCVRRSR